MPDMCRRHMSGEKARRLKAADMSDMSDMYLYIYHMHCVPAAFFTLERIFCYSFICTCFRVLTDFLQPIDVVIL